MSFSEEDLTFINENLGRQSLSTIAKKLGRTPVSLETTLFRKVGTTNTKSCTGMITAGELAKILSVDRNTIIGWTKRHGLPYKKRITRYKKSFTFIEIEAFWQWAELHKEKIDFSKLIRHSLPPEPSFVREERKKKKRKNYRGWTTLEEKQLISLVKKGSSFEKIALTLDRTPHAVAKKYYRLSHT